MDTDQPATPQNISRPDEPDDPALQHARRRGHELTDVNVWGLFAFGGALLVTIVAVMLGLVVLFKINQRVDSKFNAGRLRTEPGAQSLVRAGPDYEGPLLQVKPEEDLRWMKDHNTIDLNGYGWVDRPAGVVRLPIDRAMDLIAQRGLPPVSPGLTIEALQRQRAQPQVWGQSLRP